MSTLKRPGSPEPDALFLPSSTSFSAESIINTDPWIPYPVTRNPFLAQGPFHLRAGRSLRCITRRKRGMTPEDQKDAKYRDMRLKNNEAAKRSREKRKLSDLMRDGQLLALSDENARLRAQVLSLQYCSGLRASGRQGSVQSPVSFLFQRPMVAMGDCGSHRGSSSAARQQDSDQFGALSRRFGPSQSVNEPKSSHVHGTQRLFPPPPPPLGAHSHAAMLEGRRWPDPEQYPVSGIQPGAFLSPPHEPVFSSPVSTGWLPPYHPAVLPNPLLLPWKPPHVTPPVQHTYPSLYTQEEPDRLFGLDAPSHLSHPDMTLSPRGP